MEAISLFNNKGGVGKTTLLCNLAAFLAIERNFSVLVVDADPQCNATQSMFPDRVIEDIYSNNRFTIYDIVQPLAAGKGYSKHLSPRRAEKFGVSVIPGDPRLALTEDLLATDWSDATAGKTRGLRTTFLFHHLLERCSDFDFVLFDVGPSLGSINRSVLIASDYFVAPMSIDIFSLKAIENISLSFKNWRRQLQAGLEMNDEHEELEVDSPGWSLRFAGYVTQQYTAKTDAEGRRRPVKAFDRIMSRIPEMVQDNFLTLEADQGATLSLEEYALGSIPTFHSLIPMSQTARAPIFELKSSDGVVGAHFTKVKEYQAIIREIADGLVRNVQLLEA